MAEGGSVTSVDNEIIIWLNGSLLLVVSGWVEITKRQQVHSYRCQCEVRETT